MHLWSIDVHVELKFLANCFDVFETFLIVRTGAADPNLDFVFDQSACDFTEGANDTFEC